MKCELWGTKEGTGKRKREKLQRGEGKRTAKRPRAQPHISSILKSPHFTPTHSRLDTTPLLAETMPLSSQNNWATVLRIAYFCGCLHGQKLPKNLTVWLHFQDPQTQLSYDKKWEVEQTVSPQFQTGGMLARMTEHRQQPPQTDNGHKNMSVH